jgi:hypothetical protein
MYSLASSSKQNTANASPKPGTLTVSGSQRTSGLRHATQNLGSPRIAVSLSFQRPSRTGAIENRTFIIDGATTPVDTYFGPISTLRLKPPLVGKLGYASLVSTPPLGRLVGKIPLRPHPFAHRATVREALCPA